MENSLKKIVYDLCIPGLRNAQGPNWLNLMSFLHQSITNLGHNVEVQEWSDAQERTYKNFIVRFKGQKKGTYIIGAHYDTFQDTPGADDNASAVAVLLGILSRLSPDENLEYSWEFVFYACEEPPFFGTDEMGSWKHSSSVDAASIICMICLEMVGYFSDEPNSQDYPFAPLKWIYGSKGNYIMGVSNQKSRSEASKIIKKLQEIRPNFYRKLIPPFTFSGLDWSDHSSYWRNDIPAIMLTDTAMFRNQNYHTDKDLPETLNYEKMALFTNDLIQMIKTL